MLKTVLPLSLIVLTPFLIFATKSYAEVSVSQGSSSVDVKINNDSNSGSTSDVSKNCNTSVKITVNGETKSYDSSDCNKDVHVQSDNGGSKVEVKSEGGGAKVEVSNNSSATIQEDGAPTPTKVIQKEIKDIVEKHKGEVEKVVEEQQKNFFQTLVDSLLSFITLERKS